jgi:hypothetical protein
MIPGPTELYKCPHCGNLISKGSLLSGNNFGARLFSDGKSIAPMMPRFPDLTKCRKCDSIFWLSELKEVGSYSWDEPEDPTWKDADPAEFLNIEDSFRALESGMARDKEEEKYIRKQIWWGYNDRIRNGQNIFKDAQDELRWKENIELLLRLLDPSDTDEKIMSAELYRNLGDFENCQKLIQSLENNELDWLRDIFLNECRQKNRWVVKLDY